MSQGLPVTTLSIEPVSDSMKTIAYCIGAMKLFSEVTQNDAERIFSEISVIKNTEDVIYGEGKRYGLSSTGADYWGSQLLCMEYVFNRMIGRDMEVDGIVSTAYGSATWIYKGIFKEESLHFLNE